jgi:nicotinic acid mononucleotide adenylyltransferase
MIEYCGPIIREIEKEILNRTFLKKYKFERRRILEFLEQRFFEQRLEEMLKTQNFNALTVYELLEPLIRQLDSREATDWPKYFYYYSLSFSFPEAVPIELDASRNRIAALYLRVLKVISEFQKHSVDGTWQSRYPILLLTDDEIAALEDPTEFLTFKRYFTGDYVYEMMKLNQDVIGYTTLDHICGVHHLALKIARQLKKLGYPLDLGRVCGAAAGHDVGKFGCKPDEMSRVAYYHYFYTGEWFERRGIVYIRNVAINHSTWDLEIDALPIESLILIYSDFRVKEGMTGGHKHMMFYSLKEAFQVILDKLDNVDEAKENRYRKVYGRLRDFENFLTDLSVNIDPDLSEIDAPKPQKQRKYFALMQGIEITDNVIFASIEHNIEILYRLRDEASLNKLLEPVRMSRDRTSLRSYISILEEYYTYLTQKQKQIVMNFLYEKLISPEEDIRKQCAALIGGIIASYDEEIRKETPPSAKSGVEQLDAIDVFDLYLDRFLQPETKIIERHKKFISYSIRDMLCGYFKALKGYDKRNASIDRVVLRFQKHREDEQIRYYLVDSARILPFEDFSGAQLGAVLSFVSELLTHSDVKLKLRAYNLIYFILPFADDFCIEKSGVFRVVPDAPVSTGMPAENFAKLKLAEQLKRPDAVVGQYKRICREDLKDSSNIFLSNLKTATIDIAKRFQIELLMRNVMLYDYESCFYMAMHLCNLLKVSALEYVRNTSGQFLVALTSHLSFEQKNDIAVELIRALEMESFEFTKYIPPYLSDILLQLKPKELDEILESFEEKASTNNELLIALIEKTLGDMISKYSGYRYAFPESAVNHDNRILRMHGILFTGFVHSSRYVNQTAFHVLAKDIYANEEMTLKKREYLYRMTIKKIMSLVVNTDEANALIFYNNSASLKHIYAFIAAYQHAYGELTPLPIKRVAFFPGAFDPFTLSHKQIANHLKRQGFEVLLYVDEFSWSKRTQPNLIRRNIIKKSIAGEIDIYHFPRDISVNIANDEDLKRLQNLFPNVEVYLAVGTDVVMNASAYRGDEKHYIHEIPHLIYERGGESTPRERQILEEKIAKLHPNSLIYTIPKVYENISSTMIRDYIDENRDISSLIDPLAQNYIYEKGLYQREPAYKSMMTTKALSLEFVEFPSQSLMRDVAAMLGIETDAQQEAVREISRGLSFRIMVLRSLDDQEIIAVAMFHWLRATHIHKAFTDPSVIRFVRENSVGRIAVIDCIAKRRTSDVKDLEQIMLTEVLSNALERDFTYAVYHEKLRPQVPKELNEVLMNQGFINISSGKTGENVYVVDMSSPCTLNLDVHMLFKAPYKDSPDVLGAMSRSRLRLQKAITDIYPGKLLLNFDRGMIHETLIKKVCDENAVPVTPMEPKQYGKCICVPFGVVFRRMLLPNTVTKTLHAEKYFLPDLSKHQIRAYPFYLDIENQIKMIRSFNRPVILVDDLLNKGYRIKVLEPYFRKHNVKIQKFIVGIMSGSGKEIAEAMDLNVDAAYFIPKIKVWFYESKLYPFIDGDAIWRGSIPDSNLINSVNLILPYAPASYIVGASKEAIYNLSEVALENSIEIMSAVERVYEKLNDRLLTINRLGEVFETPRYPDKGQNIFYSNSIRPSDYISDDLEQLRKMKRFYLG